MNNYKLYFVEYKKNEKKIKLAFESCDVNEAISRLCKHDSLNFDTWGVYAFLCEIYGDKADEFCPTCYIVVNDNENTLYDITNYYLLTKEGVF